MQEVVTDPLDIQYVYYKYGYDGLVEFLQNLPDAAAAGLTITRLGREYVWGPGDGGAAGPHNGADELLAVFDRGWLNAAGNNEGDWGQPWYPLRDLDGDMVALLDIRGSGNGPGGTLPTLAAEWRYDPYGNVLWSRVHTPHPALSCGHRGVFFDRLDEPIIRFAADVGQGDVEPVVPALGQTWDTRVLVPPQAWGNGYDLPSGKAKLIGHMRNRVYLPRLMRFAQRDPNATGQLVMAAVMHSGQSMSAHPGGMQLESLFGDGPNLHGYLAGRPRGNTDPTGLFLPSPADLVASAAMVGIRGLRGGLEGMTEQYAANLEDDLDWAMDWSRPDNDYSRLSSTWVGQSFMDGMYGGLIDGLNDAVSDMTWGAWPNDEFEDAEQDSEVLQQIASGSDSAGRDAVADGKLRGVTRSSYQAARRAFASVKKGYWQSVSQSTSKQLKLGSLFKRTQSNIARMREGRAPIGKDGASVVLHHKRPLWAGGSNELRNLQPMLRRNHIELHRTNHP